MAGKDIIDRRVVVSRHPNATQADDCFLSGLLKVDRAGELSETWMCHVSLDEYIAPTPAWRAPPTRGLADDDPDSASTAWQRLDEQVGGRLARGETVFR